MRRTLDANGQRSWFAPFSLALVCCATVAFLLSPAGIGALVLVGTILFLIAALGTGPLLRGARPLRVWIGVPIGASFLSGALFARTSTLTWGPLALADILYIVGYLCLSAWLAAMTWRVGRGGAIQVFLDTTAAVIGAFLALRTIAALHGQHSMPAAGLLWASYPLLDVVALALATHLALRLRFSVPAWRWTITALVAQLGLDVTHALSALGREDDPLPGLTIIYLFTYWGLAVGATHPTVAHLSRPPAVHPLDGDRGPRPALILIAVVPAIVSLCISPEEGANAWVQPVLISALLLILFARLLITMGALTRSERTSRHRATHDPLTGLLNRATINGILAERLDRDARSGARTVVLFLDCDDFKHVNDTWGHPAGDCLLKAIAEGLPGRLDPDDILARHGGDEFLVVSTVASREDATTVAKRVIAFFEDPLPVLAGRMHLMTPSIGVAVADPGGEPSALALLEKADAALYEAKARGRAQYAVFDEDLAARAHTRAAISDALRTAIAEQAIHVGLQPIHGGSAYDELVSWEALARWTDPVLGVIPPDVFIPIAEEHGLIEALGESVLRQACFDLARLRRTLGIDASVSVNVSPGQLRQTGFADTVADALRAADLPGSALWLEVTETTLVDTGPQTLTTMSEVRDLGVRFSMDDFGTGYWSFANLLHLPIDCVKLDQSLAKRLETDPTTARQIEALLDLFASLDISRVIAEGVETPAVAAVLRAIGCPYVQGWLYGRAEPVEQILSELGQAARAS